MAGYGIRLPRLVVIDKLKAKLSDAKRELALYQAYDEKEKEYDTRTKTKMLAYLSGNAFSVADASDSGNKYRIVLYTNSKKFRKFMAPPEYPKNIRCKIDIKQDIQELEELLRLLQLSTADHVTASSRNNIAKYL